GRGGTNPRGGPGGRGRGPRPASHAQDLGNGPRNTLGSRPRNSPIIGSQKDLRPAAVGRVRASPANAFNRECVPTAVELSALAKYPFLREASAFIRSEGVTLEELLSEPAYARARALGRTRVHEALKKGPESPRVAIAPADQLSQLLAYPV